MPEEAGPVLHAVLCVAPSSATSDSTQSCAWRQAGRRRLPRSFGLYSAESQLFRQRRRAGFGTNAGLRRSSGVRAVCRRKRGLYCTQFCDVLQAGRRRIPRSFGLYSAQSQYFWQRRRAGFGTNAGLRWSSGVQAVCRRKRGLYSTQFCDVLQAGRRPALVGHRRALEKVPAL